MKHIPLFQKFVLSTSFLGLMAYQNCAGGNFDFSNNGKLLAAQTTIANDDNAPVHASDAPAATATTVDTTSNTTTTKTTTSNDTSTTNSKNTDTKSADTTKPADPTRQPASLPVVSSAPVKPTQIPAPSSPVVQNPPVHHDDVCPPNMFSDGSKCVALPINCKLGTILNGTKCITQQDIDDAKDSKQGHVVTPHGQPNPNATPILADVQCTPGMFSDGIKCGALKSPKDCHTIKNGTECTDKILGKLDNADVDHDKHHDGIEVSCRFGYDAKNNKCKPEHHSDDDDDHEHAKRDHDRDSERDHDRDEDHDDSKVADHKCEK